MRACRLTAQDKWLFDGDHKISGGQYAAERIFALADPPTAVVCSNDMTAIGLLQSASRMGRSIPRELSLIGFDDLFLCEIVHPTLTTLHLSRQDIASRAFFALHTAREQLSTPQTSVIMPRLVIRASTGPCATTSVE
jgi:LacI family transcriptional regulator